MRLPFVDARSSIVGGDRGCAQWHVREQLAKAQHQLFRECVDTLGPAADDRQSDFENISAWSGAAWDRGRSNLYIWGGDDYTGGDEGNEVYIFSGKTGLWSRGSLPSQVTATNGIEHTVDGVMNAPLSGESWDNVVFLNNVNRMAVIGVSKEGITWHDPSTTLPTGPYFWDPAKADPNKVSGLTGSQVNPGAFPNVLGGEMWQNRNKPMGEGNHLRGTSAYVNVDGKDVVYVTDTDDNLYRYTVRDLDPAHDTWEQIGRRPANGERGEGAAAIDTKNNMFLHVLSRNSFGFWDVDYPGGEWENLGFRCFLMSRAAQSRPTFGTSVCSLTRLSGPLCCGMEGGAFGC